MSNEKMNIATHANKLDKLNKKQLLALIEKLYQGSNNHDLLHSLASVYKAIAPSITTGKADKDDWAWVCHAMAKKDVRFYLNYVYCDGDRIMATDGHRLHLIPNTLNKEVGYYDKLGNKVTDVDARYPDLDRVIPKTEDRQLVAFELDNLTVSKAGNSEAFLIPYGDNHVAINTKYLTQAVAGMDKPCAWVLSASDSIRIENGDRLAVIMPMRV